MEGGGLTTRTDLVNGAQALQEFDMVGGRAVELATRVRGGTLSARGADANEMAASPADYAGAAAERGLREKV